MNVLRILVCGVAAGALFGAVSMAANDPVKASRNCRKEIGSKLSKVPQTGLALVDACHKRRDKGKFTGDCNDLAAADLKGKLVKTEAAVTKGIVKKCLAGDPVLGNYPGGDPDGVFFPVAENAVEAAGAALLGAPQIQGDKAKIKCHAAISKATVKDVAEILKNAVKCQASVDKLASTFGVLDGDCVVAPASAGPKGEAAIAKACGALTGADVGGCDPLPGCVTTAATATGQQLATAIYGEPTPGCGNTIVDPGEDCDDGNAITTDGCIDCTFATCGDGFVHAGVELCGDAPAGACTAPGPSTCQVTPCTPSGTTRSITVRFAKPAAVTIGGLVVALDYPETKVRIPGSASDAQVLGAVSVAPSGLTTIDDRDYEVQVSITAFPVDPGDFFTVQFDDCSAVPAPPLSEFACIVRSASNDLGADVTNQVTCSVKTP